MNKFISDIPKIIFIVFTLSWSAHSQPENRELSIAKNGAIEILNLFGKISISSDPELEKVLIVGENSNSSSITTEYRGSRLLINVSGADKKSRVDLDIKVPARIKLKAETSDGEVRVSGNFEKIEIKTATGTIASDIPLDDLEYNLVWTASRPRFLSDIELEDVKEKAAGKFVVKGKILEGKTVFKKNKAKKISDENAGADEPTEDQAIVAEKDPEKIPTNVKIDFSTSRGIILLNVNPGSVPADLGEKPLTNAAKAIIRSGDTLLMDAIRRASPKFFGDYARTLPPFRNAPVLDESKSTGTLVSSHVKRVLVQVTDINNRSIPNLEKDDFLLTERGSGREILAVEPATSSFNLVLLVDVSGSVDNYVNFIRKAARNFVNTVDKNDKVAIIIFNQDVEVLSNFTTDKVKLSESLDTFDAGGGTAYYDALAYTLAETLRPLKGDRTGVVVLTDGEDTRSFLPFDAITGAVQESGALIYPLYVPNGLIAAARNQDPNDTIDPLRTRYIGLTSRAEAEGEELAKVSGGVYYPIRQLDELQKAYDDIVLQLRTAYSITYRSDLAVQSKGNSPFLKVRVKRDSTFVKLGSVVEVPAKEIEKLEPKSVVTESTQNEENKPPFWQKIGYSPKPQNDSSNKSVEITGEVESIKYKQFLGDNLKTFKSKGFDVNKATGAFLLDNEKEKIAVSRWISPKRTRSYPYERVYDTLTHSGRKVAVIPVVKDEGLGGERDFLQWDTISLLSLLDVHVVLAYYNEAEKNTGKFDKITSQKFDNKYVLSRLDEVFNFKGTSREWNEREVKKLKSVLEKAKTAYLEISKKTKTYLHDVSALDELIKVAETPEKFIEFSRGKSIEAQTRESETLQPKEALASDTKGKVTITNALFGKYYFTVDETRIEPETVYLIEAKHSQRTKFPSENDIKDGLVKMMVYTNLKNVKLGTKAVNYKVQIRLTSNQLKGSIDSNVKTEIFDKFCSENLIDSKQKSFLTKLFQEARENNFTIILEYGETSK
jgi:VWFA-related protein